MVWCCGESKWTSFAPGAQPNYNTRLSFLITTSSSLPSVSCAKFPCQRTRSYSLLGPEIWNVENGRMFQKGKTAVLEDFVEKTPRGSGSNTPARSRLQTPIASAVGTPAGSGAEDGAAKPVGKRKKKLTRNQLKAQEERRRLRKLRWLSEGGPKPEDTDSDLDP